MEQEKKFLPFLIDEDIYVIKEKQVEVTSDPLKNESKVNQEPEKSEFRFKGNPNANVLIMVDSFSEAEELFLAQILKAVSLSLEKVALVDTLECDVEILNNISYKAFETIIFFFKNRLPGFEKYPENYYQHETVHGSKMLLAHSLSDISADIERKKLLWSELQKLFEKI